MLSHTYISVITVCLYILLSISIACASSYSTTFNINNESLDFAHNNDYFQSSSFTMDLSDISWTDSIAESTNFTIIDSNSGVDLQPPAPPPPPPPSGGGGPIAGGRPERGVTDVAVILSQPTEEPEDELILHPLEKEEEVLIAFEEEPVKVIEKKGIEDVAKIVDIEPKVTDYPTIHEAADRAVIVCTQCMCYLLAIIFILFNLFGYHILWEKDQK